MLRGAHKILRQLVQETERYRTPLLVDLSFDHDNDLPANDSPNLMSSLEVLHYARDLSNLLKTVRDFYYQLDDFLIDRK